MLEDIGSLFLDFLLPLLAWSALALVVLRWLFVRWETRLAAERSFKLRFPLSSMVFLSRRIVIEELLHDPELREAIQMRERETGTPSAELVQQLRKQAQEMVPAFKAVFYFSIGYWLARTLLLTLYRVKLLRVSSDDYEKIGRDATVVLIMNHRSNMDVLLVNYLLARRSTVAHAAGEWARLWPLHHLVKLAGNYVVDRDSNDPIYRLLLKRYVQMAVARGIHLGIFPEGSLSRDGRLQALNFGLLNYVATAAWPGYDRDVVFIPVSFNYDRIPEQQRLVFEDDTAFRNRSNLYVAFNSLRFCVKFLLTPLIPRRRRFGWACASFGDPVSLRDWQRARGIDLQKLPRDKRREYIASLGRQLMAAALEIGPVLPTHILATAILDQPTDVFTRKAVFRRCTELRSALQTVGAVIHDYDTEGPLADREALERLEQLKLLEVVPDDASGEARLHVVPGQRPMLEYYANSIAHYLEPQRTDLDSARPAMESAEGGDSRRLYLRTVYESFERIQHAKPDSGQFIAHFYRHFLSASEGVAAKFSGTDMQRQQAHLRQSLEHMVDYYITGSPSARLRSLARGHGRNELNIATDYYQLWLESLLAAVRHFDPDCNRGVELSWTAVMAPGIAFMRSQYESRDSELPGPAATPETPVEAQGIVRWIEHWAGRSPEKTALVCGPQRLSYRDLFLQSGRLAASLRHRLGVEEGDRVAFISPNRNEFIVLVFACARLGAILVPVNFRLGAVEQTDFIRRAAAKALFADSACAENIDCAGLGCTAVVMDSLLSTTGASRGRSAQFVAYEDLLEVPAPMRTNAGRMDSDLFIFFTSGSTGEPKGAVLTQGAIHWNALNSKVMHDFQRDDHVLTTLPFFHVGGMNIQTLPALHAGATVTILPRFDAAEFVQLVARERHTLTVLVPTQMRQLMALPEWFSADLDSLKAVATGSTMIGRDLVQAWANKGLPLIQIYGCTESGPIAIHQTVEDSERSHSTSGYPALYTDIMLADSEGRPVAPGAEGEICLRGPHIMRRYWRDDAATASTLRDGWLRTGDLGYRDNDGCVRVVGRIKRLIISGGENIHPAEIEEVLERFDQISEAAVVGLPDPKWDEIPVAMVVCADGQTLDEEALRAHLDQNLGRFKHPRRVVAVAELPHTPLGKIDYPKVNVLLGQ